jgi:LemA protein
MSSVLIFVVVLVIAAGAVAMMHNSLVRKRQGVREAWSAIETELKRRYDLVPNLVSVVQGYAAHEAETLQAVTAARNAAAANNGSPMSQADTENVLSGALRQLFAVAEAYPELKANQSFGQLQSELAETEDRISSARRFYNANVRELNTAVESFPGNVVARQFGFGPEEYFELDEGSREPVAVSFPARPSAG